MHKEK